MVKITSPNLQTLRNLPLRTKLMLLISTIMIISLCLAVAAITFGNWHLYRELMRENAKAQAEAQIGNGLVSLSFNDEHAAQKGLDELKNVSNVVAAILYDAQDREFAAYYRHGEKIHIPALAPHETDREYGKQWIVQQPIERTDKLIGRLILVTDLEPFLEGLRLAWIISLLAIFLTLILSFILFHWALGIITEPLTQLSQVMSKVRAGYDYSLRLNPRNEDDLGKLAHGFNAMLEEIEQRDRRLEQTVTQRTEQLAQSVESLRIARDKAEQANQAKSAFLANMSHELRTPLNAILGFAQIMGRSTNLPPRHKQQAQSIYSGGQHLLTLITDILDLAKVEAGRLELFTEDIDITRFFQDMEDMFHFSAEEKRIDFSCQMSASLPQRIVIDPKRLRQVVINLLGNAIKFTEEGKVDLQVDYIGGRLHMWFKDTGPGIPLEQQEEIFKPFSQTGNKQHKLQGTGLGLAITVKIINLMQGKISLESHLGQGSCFHVRIPVKIATVPAVEKPKQAAQGEIIGYHSLSDEPSLRILLTDDIADNREVLSQILQPLGFDTKEAANGEACLQIARTWHPHLVLMDLRMPGADGLETTRHLHAAPGLENLPVIIVSASVFQEDQEKSRSAGCVDYLRKPVERDALLQMIYAHLPLQWKYEQVSADKIPPYRNIPLNPEQKETLTKMLKRGAITELTDYLENLIQTPECPKQAYDLLELAKTFQLDEMRRHLNIRI